VIAKERQLVLRIITEVPLSIEIELIALDEDPCKKSVHEHQINKKARYALLLVLLVVVITNSKHE
jgi:homoserine trans-succinylase